MNNEPQSERDARPTAADLGSIADRLACYKRASLRSQAQRAAWQLGALVRRVEHEAPEIHQRLRGAVEALQLLSAQLAPELAGDLPARPSGPDVGANEIVRNETLEAGSARRGEFF